MALLIAKPAEKTVVLVPRQLYARALKAIIDSGCFHPDEHVESPEVRKLRSDIDAVYSKLRDMVLKAKALGAEVSVSEEVEVKVASEVRDSIEKLLSLVEQLYKGIEKLIESYSNLTSPESELFKALQVIEYYSFIEADLEALSKGSTLRAKLYRVETRRALEATTKLSQLPVIVLEAKGIEEGYSLLVVIYPSFLEENISSVMVSVRAMQLQPPEGFPPSPSQLIRVVREELEKLPREIVASSPKLAKSLAIVETLRRILRVLGSTRFTSTMALIEGFVLEEDIGRLRKSLEEHVGSSYIITRIEEPERGEETRKPSYVSVGKLLKPFMDTVAMFGYPRPREIVPAVMMFVTLPVIYGLMFPDLGHGLVLLVLGYVVYKKLSKSMGKLVISFAIAACVAGILCGEFFGPYPPIAGWLSAIWGGHPPYASPLHPFSEHLTQILAGKMPLKASEEAAELLYNVIYVSVFLGTLLLTVSSATSIANGILFRDKKEIVAGIGKTLAFAGAFLAFLVGLMYSDHLVVAAKILGAASLNMPAPPSLKTIGLAVRYTVLSGLGIAFIAPLVFGHGGIGERGIEGFMELFDLLLMLIGNTISFLRIMGIMLAHSGLMFGFTLLALMCRGNPLMFALVYIMGNVLVIGLESIVAYAHSLRLHFYEMFSKFYHDGGIPLNPVQAPRMVRISVE